MLDLTLLRTLVAVFRTGSLTRAAKLLHLSQSAVSLQLQALEQQAGRKLFVREARGVTPTPFGAEVAITVEPHIEALASAADLLRGHGGTVSTSVIVAGDIDALATRILPALAPLVLRGLRLVVHSRLLFDSDVLDAVATSAVDIGVVLEPRPRPGLAFERLYEDEIYLVAAPAYARKLPRSRRPRAAAIRLGPFAAFNENMPVVRAAVRRCFGVEVAGRPAVVVPDLRAVADAIAAGAGVGALPASVAEPLLADGSLVRLSAESGGSFRVHLATRPGTEGRPAIATVRARLMAVFSGPAKP